jgi:hypothetical protein
MPVISMSHNGINSPLAPIKSSKRTINSPESKWKVEKKHLMVRFSTPHPSFEVLEIQKYLLKSKEGKKIF